MDIDFGRVNKKRGWTGSLSRVWTYNNVTEEWVMPPLPCSVGPRRKNLLAWVLQLLEMEGVQKEATMSARTSFIIFVTASRLFNADYSRKYLSVASEEQTPPADVESSTVIALTCWASGNLNRSECCTFGDYAQHGCNQEVRAAQSSQTPRTSTHSCLRSSHTTICVCALFFKFLDLDWSWWQRLLF